MATIEKRLSELEKAIQPSGRIFTAWPTDTPGLYELLQTDEVMTIEAIRSRLAPADVLLLVVYDTTPRGKHD